jgi:hypothetical protein
MLAVRLFGCRLRRQAALISKATGSERSDPRTTIVNIGATSGGIGVTRAKEVAKALPQPGSSTAGE